MGSPRREKQSTSINTRGGRRRGAGRRRGLPNKVTAEVRQRVLASGKTPLEVLQYVYEELFAMAQRMKPKDFVVVDSQVVDQLSLLERAAEVAAKAAPYMHARLQAIEHAGEGGGPIQQRVVVEFV